MFFASDFLNANFFLFYFIQWWQCRRDIWRLYLLFGAGRSKQKLSFSTFMKPHMPFNVIFKILSFIPKCIETGQYENFWSKINEIVLSLHKQCHRIVIAHRMFLWRSVDQLKIESGGKSITANPGGVNAIKAPRYQNYLDQLID